MCMRVRYIYIFFRKFIQAFNTFKTHSCYCHCKTLTQYCTCYYTLSITNLLKTSLSPMWHSKTVLVSCFSPWPDPFEAFIIFSIRHEIRRIDLHKRDYSLLVPGLRNTIALDFHFNRSLLYWTDVVEDKIYRGRLSETGGMCAHTRTQFLHI